MTDPTRSTEVFPVQEKNVPLLLRDLLAIEYPLVLKRVELVRANLKALHGYVQWMESVAAAANVPLPLPDVDPEVVAAVTRAPAEGVSDEPCVFGNGSAIDPPLGGDFTYLCPVPPSAATIAQAQRDGLRLTIDRVDLETYPVDREEPNAELASLASVVLDMIPRAFRVKPEAVNTMEDAPEATA